MIPYSGKVWRIVCDLPNKLVLTINNLLADLLICQTFFRQMLKTSQFAKLPPPTFLVYGIITLKVTVAISN